MCYEEVGVKIRCVRPFRTGLALQWGARRGIVPDDVWIEITEKFCEMAGDATDRWKLAQRRHGF